MKLILFFVIAFVAISSRAQQSISEAREMAIGQSVTISGIAINGSELGRIRYIQDNTAGIAAYGNEVENIKRGDSVTVSGTLYNYNNLLELSPVNSVTIHSSGNELPAPKVITIDEIGETYEGQLIKIDSLLFKNISGTFEGNKEYTLTFHEDETKIYINRDAASIIGSLIPTDTFSLTAICTQYYNENQLLPRDMNDFVLFSSVKVTAPLSVEDFNTSEISLSWQTDVEGYSCIIYGSEPCQNSLNNLAVATSVSSGNEFINEATISGLDAASIIYAQGYTIVGNDTAFTSISAFATESNSSGDIKVYFNTDVEHSVSTGEYAEVLDDAIEDTLIAYISRAEESIDMCIYNINNDGISNITEALNDSYNRGVKVRVIACGTRANFGLDNIGSDIPEFPFLISPDDDERSGIMHNKFLIFDANSTDANKPIVWTGSTNFTYGQIVSDANNVVIVQDQTLAAAYKIEFEEMWGSSGDQPDETNAKFGEEKTNNTPHEFFVGGKRVECYFSPSDGTNQQIINTLETADERIDIATNLIWREDIANTLSILKQSGILIYILTDDENKNDQAVNNILSGILGNSYLFDEDDVPGTLHHKYAIIDHSNPASDPIVLTGSHNWSSAANNDNDENTLVIHDATIANLYYQNFSYRFHENGGIIDNLKLIEEQNSQVEIYPNPVKDKIRISSEKEIQKVELFTLTGNKLLEEINIKNPELTLDVSNLKTGIYFMRITDKNNSMGVYKIIFE